MFRNIVPGINSSGGLYTTIRINCSRVLESGSNVQGKPFDTIPGPRSYPLIGTLWKYFPIFGNYDLKHLDRTGHLKLREYGKIVKEVMGPGGAMVNVFSPKDIEAVFKAGGRFPERKSHAAIRAYRSARPHLYASAGLFPTNGEEWWRLRRQFQKPVSPLQETRLFLPSADIITRHFLRSAIGTGKLIEDFLPVVSKLNLELTWKAVFGESLNCFDCCPSDEPIKVINAAEAVNETILSTDTTESVWSVYPTKDYKNVERNLEFLENVAIRGIEKCKASGYPSICKEFLLLEGVNEKDILGMVIDLLLGGVDTTSYTSCFMLYHVAKNPNVQKELQDEARNLIPDSTRNISIDVINRASYSRAVLKETFRLNPISIGTTRILQEDTLLSGFNVPRGTLVMCQNMVACHQEENFDKAECFIPERWLDEGKIKVSPYLVLPFGHGLRTCLARRRAEQNLLLLLLLVAKDYKMEWLGDTLGVVTPLINKPDGPVKIHFS